MTVYGGYGDVAVRHTTSHERSALLVVATLPGRGGEVTMIFVFQSLGNLYASMQKSLAENVTS